MAVGDWEVAFADFTDARVSTRADVERLIAAGKPDTFALFPVVGVWRCVEGSDNPDDEVWVSVWQRGVWASGTATQDDMMPATDEEGAMDREALIERLAEIAYDNDEDFEDEDDAYGDLGEHLKEEFRERNEALIPAVVEFVAEWIEAQGQVHGEILPIEGSSLALKWRDEMTD